MPKSPKVALINPKMFLKSYRFFPLGLGYLASSLEMNQIEYSFYDLHFDWIKTSQAMTHISNDGIPDLFAVTGLLTSYQSLKELCVALKDRFPTSQIVIGGRITVMDPVLLFKHIPADFIIRGEGEEGLVQLVEQLDGNHDYDQVQGLAYKDHDTIHRNGEAKPIKNISQYRIPYHRFDMDKYIKRCNIQSPNTPSINMLSSRGCPYSCSFCNNSKEKKPVRFYDVDQIAQSLDYLMDRYNLKHVTFNDDIFTVNKTHMKHVCNILEKRGLSFSMSTRLDFLEEESIQLLDQSGCHYLCVGIESPAPKVAEIIDKRLDLDKYQKNIDSLKKSNIIVNYGFMIGYLGETEETINETRNFVIKNRIIYSAFFANAFPMTKLYDMIRHLIGNEEEYLRRLFSVDLTRDYLINMTDIPVERLYRLRDELIVDSVINTFDIKLPVLSKLLRTMALQYLLFMRSFGLNIGIIKRIFEFINMSIIKPFTKITSMNKTAPSN